MRLPETVCVGQKYYESLAELATDRGNELGLGRPLTADEMVNDPVISPILEKIIDTMLGVAEEPS